MGLKPYASGRAVLRKLHAWTFSFAAVTVNLPMGNLKAPAVAADHACCFANARHSGHC